MLMALAWHEAFASNVERVCDVRAGDRVVLSAGTVDPDVFLWDSRVRLIAYVAGDWGSAKEVLSHATLIAPGTLAVVTSCRMGEAHPNYSAIAQDVIGVRILTGGHRDTWGWVSSDDVHRMRRSKKIP
jgi:hypothetical protein